MATETINHFENKNVFTDEFIAGIVSNAKLAIENLEESGQYSTKELVQILVDVLQNTLFSNENLCTQLQSDLTETLTQRDILNTQNEENLETIQTLQAQISDKTELENAWKERDAALVRERIAQQQIQSLREREAANAPKGKPDQSGDELGGDLSKYKINILREYDRLNSEVVELKRRLKLQRMYGMEIEARANESETKMNELYKLLDETSAESLKKKVLIEQLKAKEAEISIERSKLSDKLSDMNKQKENLLSNIRDLNSNLANLTTTLEDRTVRLNESNAKLTLAERAVVNLKKECDELHIEQNQNINLLNLKESEVKHLMKVSGDQSRARDKLQRKLLTIETVQSKLVQTVAELQNSICTYQKDQEASKRALDAAKKHTENVIHEREAVRKNLQKADLILDEQRNTIKLHTQNALILQSEINAHLSTIKKTKSVLLAVEKERNKYAAEAQKQEKKALAKQEELNLKMAYIAELKGLLSDTKQQLTLLQQQFDTVSAERSAMRRELCAAIEDRDLLREKFGLTTNQRDQLIETISRKEHELLIANKSNEKLNRDKMSLKMEIQNIKNQHQTLENEYNKMVRDNDELVKTLSEDEKKFHELKKEMTNIKREKDLVGSQLVRRNDEMGLLIEKLQISELAINKGESEYNHRLDDIRLLKIEIANMRQQNDLLKNGIANNADMRIEVLQLNRELNQERVKCRALEGVIATPVNGHRWRKLEGSDPERMELITKNQVLQTRLLNYSKRIVQLENCLIQSEKEKADLNGMLDRYPVRELKENLTVTKRKLNKQSKALKVSAAEFKASESDAKVMDRSLAAVRVELYQAKSENTKLKEIINSNKNERLKEHLKLSEMYDKWGSEMFLK